MIMCRGLADAYQAVLAELEQMNPEGELKHICQWLEQIISFVTDFFYETCIAHYSM